MKKLDKIELTKEEKLINKENAFEPLLAALLKTGRSETECVKFIDDFYQQQKEIDDFFRNVAEIYGDSKEVIEDC